MKEVKSVKEFVWRVVHDAENMRTDTLIYAYIAFVGYPLAYQMDAKYFMYCLFVGSAIVLLLRRKRIEEFWKSTGWYG